MSNSALVLLGLWPITNAPSGAAPNTWCAEALTPEELDPERRHPCASIANVGTASAAVPVATVSGATSLAGFWMASDCFSSLSAGVVSEAVSAGGSRLRSRLVRGCLLGLGFDARLSLDLAGNFSGGLGWRIRSRLGRLLSVRKRLSWVLISAIGFLLWALGTLGVPLWTLGTLREL